MLGYISLGTLVTFCESRKPSALCILASIPTVFIDDISVYFWTKREHGNHLQVYGRFEGEIIINNYMISLLTCHFWIDEGICVGRVIIVDEIMLTHRS